jgi:hypothetical protein
MDLTCHIEWNPAGEIALDATEKLRVPELTTGPGICQWVFAHDGRERRYIGEAENLRRRFHHYRNPGPTQSTNIRMLDRCRRVLAAGGSIELLLARATVTADGTPLELDLASPFARRFIENAALLQLMAEDGEIINGKGHGNLMTDEVLR